MTPTDHDIAEVEQCDREAAADLANAIFSSLDMPLRADEFVRYRSGGVDDSKIVQAFARHRLATQPQPTDEMVEKVAQVIQNAAGDIYWYCETNSPFDFSALAKEAIAAMGEGRCE